MKNIALENLITSAYDKPQMTREQLTAIGKIHSLQSHLLEKEEWAMLDLLQAVEKYVREH